MTIGQAIRRAYEGAALTQVQLAEKLSTDQAVVSRWVHDNARPSLEKLVEIEQVCSRPRGFILRAAGYVDEVLTVRDLLAIDPGLSDLARRVLLRAYEEALIEDPPGNA